MARRDIGSRLRRAREQRGLTLGDIAEATKISMPSLQAMERDDFNRLPGGVFRKAYVRSFASEVGLDADELARDFRSRYEAKYGCESFPRHDGRVRHLALALVVVVAILACGLLLLNRDESGASTDEEAVVFADETSMLLLSVDPKQARGGPGHWCCDETQ